MAIGKNKRLSKGKKGGKKKIVDSFLKKEWYDIKAPQMFQNPDIGKTPVNRSTGTKQACDSLKGRVVEINLADINSSQLQHTKFKFIVQEVAGKECLTTFYGMDTTTDKLWSIVHKKSTLIELWTDIVSSDGFLMRFFVLCFSARSENQLKLTSYAKHSHVKRIRAIITNILHTTISKCNIREVMEQLCSDSLSKDIEKAVKRVRIVRDVLIRKVKVLRMPKHDPVKFMELYSDNTAHTDRINEPPVLMNAEEVSRDFIEPAVLTSV